MKLTLMFVGNIYCRIYSLDSNKGKGSHSFQRGPLLPSLKSAPEAIA